MAGEVVALDKEPCGELLKRALRGLNGLNKQLDSLLEKLDFVPKELSQPEPPPPEHLRGLATQIDDLTRLLLLKSGALHAQLGSPSCVEQDGGKQAAYHQGRDMAPDRMIRG